MNKDGQTCYWINIFDKYPGLKFRFNGSRYYGWACMSVEGEPFGCKLYNIWNLVQWNLPE